MKQNEHFVLKGSALTVVEASIYESRRGIAETNIYELVFDGGVPLKVKTSFIANLEQIEVKEEDEEGRVVLAIDGGGSFQTFGENREVLFECDWHVIEEPRVVIFNNLITELKLTAEYSGIGINNYEGHTVSGQMMLGLVGLDESGMGIYEIRGDGTIQPANE